jgi:hypothetical protein
MLLVFDQTGERFATGAVDYSVTGQNAMTRLNLEVIVEGRRTTAIVDTGASYVIFSPELAEEAGIDPAAALVEAALLIRGNRILGGLHRVTLELPAVIGNNLALEVTAFIPDAARNFGQTHPSFLGLFGCLESIRFAVDPHTQMFFFGPRPVAA